jgi:sporulation protein YlmC with PRC-barrel domain
MLRSIKQLYGYKLGASDGEIGHVKDFYFDDQSWAVRYLIADTGTWLPGRQVLISPHSVGRLQETAKDVLLVNLTREQIENSPSIDEHKPVSRQYEEEYYRYFGWPYYWQGDALWGLSGFPILELPPSPIINASNVPFAPQPGTADPHLRSTQAVKGYQADARVEGVIGHVNDFMIDTESWAISQLVIQTGHRLSGKTLLISTKNVNRISYDESMVFVTMTAEHNSP